MKLVNGYLVQDKSSGIFYVRLNIPPDLHQQFGIKTLKRSLRTRDKFDAGVNCLRFIQHYKNQFIRLRNMPEKKSTQLISVKTNNSEVTIDTGDDEKDYELATKWQLEHALQEIEEISKPSPTPLTQIIDKYCEEQESVKDWTEKSAQEYRAVYNLLKDILPIW